MVGKVIFGAILVLVLASCNDLQAYVPGIEPTPTITATVTRAPDPSPTPLPSVTAQATRAIVWQVCTGVENGTLHVRGCAGTGCGVVRILREGERVTLAGVSEDLPSGRWLLITSPVQGWVNASYVSSQCESSESE